MVSVRDRGGAEGVGENAQWRALEGVQAGRRGGWMDGWNQEQAKR